MEELLEMITWSQLGIHDKPVSLIEIMKMFLGIKPFFWQYIDEIFLLNFDFKKTGGCVKC